MAKGIVLPYQRGKNKRSSSDSGPQGYSFYDTAFLADRGVITSTTRRRKRSPSHPDQRKRA